MSAAYPTPGEIGDELYRIIQAYQREHPGLVAAGKLSPELAEHRLACLMAAWSRILVPSLVVVGPGHFKTVMELAIEIADARDVKRLQTDHNERKRYEES